jgi:hypothetical protein
MPGNGIGHCLRVERGAIVEIDPFAQRVGHGQTILSDHPFGGQTGMDRAIFVEIDQRIVDLPHDLVGDEETRGRLGIERVRHLAASDLQGGAGLRACPPCCRGYRRQSSRRARGASPLQQTAAAERPVAGVVVDLPLEFVHFFTGFLNHADLLSNWYAGASRPTSAE